MSGWRGLTLTEPPIEPNAVTPRINEAGVRFDPSLAFNRRELKNLLDIWDALRHGRRMPARADLNLFDLKPHLGNLLLVDVEREPLRFRYRLVGTKITNVVHRDVTGQYFEDIYTGRLLDSMIEVQSWVVNECAPLRVFSRTGHPHTRVYAYEGLLLPLSANGETANMVLGELLFTPITPRAGNV